MGKKRSKRSILILFTFIISIISTIAVGTISISYGKKNTDKVYKENVEQTLYTVLSIIEDKVDGYEKSLNTLIAKGDFTSLKAIQKDMAILTKSDNTILNIYFADTQTGSLTLSIESDNNDSNDWRKSSWYQQVMSNPTSLQMTEPYNDDITGRPTITLLKGVVKNNKTYGAIGIDIDLTDLKDSLSIFKYGQTGNIEITDRNGNVLIHSDQSKIGSNEPMQYSIWSDIQANQSGRMKFENNSVKYDGYYTTYNGMGWKIMLKNELSELNASSKMKIIITSVVAIITLISGVVLFGMISKAKGKKPSRKKVKDTEIIEE